MADWRSALLLGETGKRASVMPRAYRVFFSNDRTCLLAMMRTSLRESPTYIMGFGMSGQVEAARKALDADW